jgi:hypothetical protein
MGAAGLGLGASAGVGARLAGGAVLPLYPELPVAEADAYRGSGAERSTTPEWLGRKLAGDG